MEPISPDVQAPGFFFFFFALILGTIVAPFEYCGKKMGCIGENYGKTKNLYNDEGRKCGEKDPASLCRQLGYLYWDGTYREDGNGTHTGQ